MSDHRYEARTRWTGSTGGGWESYDRAERRLFTEDLRVVARVLG